MENLATLAKLELTGWRQFDDVTITFHPSLTVLTGQNGAGKTTILNLIAPHFGWRVPMATVPSLIDRVMSYLTGVWQKVTRQSAKLQDVPESETDVVGTLTYSDGSVTQLLVPSKTPPNSSTYRISYSDQHPVQGMYIPSHRPLYLPSDSRAVADGVTWTRRQAFDAYVDRFRPQWTLEMPQYLQGFETATPLSVLKQVLVALPEGTRSNGWEFTLRAFEGKLAKVLPQSLGFEELQRRSSEIVLVTSTGDFPIDAVSGGIAAVIDMTWQIFAYPNDGKFVVLIDEPENHLHPEMQRTILPQLVDAFEEAQFVVATHSPLVVTSSPDCTVYALLFDNADSADAKASASATVPLEASSSRTSALPERKGKSLRRVHADEQHDFARAGTTDDTLRNLLGLDYTMPEWAAEKLHRSAVIIADANVSDESLRKVKSDLSEAGLGEYMTLALKLVSEKIREAESSEPAS